MAELKEWNWETQEREWAHGNKAQVVKLINTPYYINEISHFNYIWLANT